jgi:hypothetical protein
MRAALLALLLAGCASSPQNVNTSYQPNEPPKGPSSVLIRHGIELTEQGPIGLCIYTVFGEDRQVVEGDSCVMYKTFDAKGLHQMAVYENVKRKVRIEKEIDARHRAILDEQLSRQDIFSEERQAPTTWRELNSETNMDFAYRAEHPTSFSLFDR